MSNDLSSASLGFSGDAAVEQAIAVLRRFADDGQFNQVHIKLSISWDFTPQESRRGLVTRQKGSEGNYLYTISDFGESELERLGRANV